MRTGGLKTIYSGKHLAGRGLSIAAILWTAFALAGCGGGGGSGGGGGGGTGPNAPTGVVAFAGDAAVTLTWVPVPVADHYTVYWSTAPGVTKQTGTAINNVKAPFQHLGLTNLQRHYYVVASVNNGKEGGASVEVSAIPRATAGQFDPPWSTVPPSQTLSISYDGNLSPEANGLLLAAAIAALGPGDRLEIGDGVWSMPDVFSIDLTGNAGAPIWIVAAPGTRPTITRADANDAVIHVGAVSGASYLALIGLEIIDGNRGIDLWNAEDIWINLNLMSGTGNTPIAADNLDTARLYITRNQIDHAGGEGHGIVLGTNDGGVVSMNTVIAQNQISHCFGTNATGIWVRQGSFGNWIVENFVHDTDWPCILVAGTFNNPWNTIERNTCYNAKDNVMEVQSQAFVRNNLMINGVQGFSSQDDFDEVREIEVVHNTIINNRRGANLLNWHNEPDLVFANNAVYSNTSESVRFESGWNGVYLNGNVVLGPVEVNNQTVTNPAFAQGSGLSDFENVTWNGINHNAIPAVGSLLINAADPAQHLPEDLTGAPRDPVTMETGCLDVL